MKDGTAMAASKAMIATTIMNSIRVNPFFCFFIFTLCFQLVNYFPLRDARRAAPENFTGAAYSKIGRQNKHKAPLLPHNVCADNHFITGQLG